MKSTRGARARPEICSRSCVTFSLALVISLPLASIISLPLSLMLSRQRPASETVVPALLRTHGVSALRGGAYSAGGGDGDEGGYDYAGGSASGWHAGGAALAGALPDEDIRLEAVRVDYAATKHYGALCDATQSADYLLGADASAMTPASLQWRAINKEAPIICAAGNFFMVDMRDNKIADDLLTYLFREEPWSIELWVGILSASRCRRIDALPGFHACRANWASLLAGRRPLVVDFGANHGFFGLLGARLGYDVVAVDPQPHCAEYVRTAAAASEFRRFNTVNAFLAKDGKLNDGKTSMNIEVRRQRREQGGCRSLPRSPPDQRAPAPPPTS